MLNVEGGGQFLVRNLQLYTNILKIDSSGTMSASGQGLTSGSGAGATKGGGGYGGRGGAYSASGRKRLSIIKMK